MELKAELKYPYTEEERVDFIVTQNHEKGYEIREVETTYTEEIEAPYTETVEKAGYNLEAWGYTEEEIREQERENINNLSMTRGDVFEALILAKGLGKAQLREMIEKEDLDEMTKMLYLNRFDEALEFYRGYPVFNLLGAKLGFTSEQLDKFFETKDYTYLLNE